MKYVITQKQIDGLRETITNYLDSNFTPFGGWESRESYKKKRESTGEIFLHFVEENGFGFNDAETDAHMWYSDCDNPNLSEPLPKGECPLVALPSAKHEALEAFFGDIWKPVFKKWFENKVNLPIKTLYAQSS